MIYIDMKELFLFILLSICFTNAHSQHIYPVKEVFSQDKLLHLGAGYMTGASITAIADLCNSKNPHAWGILTSALVAGGKEYYDYRTGTGTVEGLDAWMTFIGGVLGSITVSIPISKRTPLNYAEKKRYNENFINNDPFNPK